MCARPREQSRHQRLFVGNCPDHHRGTLREKSLKKEQWPEVASDGKNLEPLRSCCVLEIRRLKQNGGVLLPFNLTCGMQQAIARVASTRDTAYVSFPNVHLDANVFSWFAQPLGWVQEQAKSCRLIHLIQELERPPIPHPRESANQEVRRQNQPRFRVRRWPVVHPRH